MSGSSGGHGNGNSRRCDATARGDPGGIHIGLNAKNSCLKLTQSHLLY